MRRLIDDRGPLRPLPDDARRPKPPPATAMKTLAVFNVKGGVGKTAAAVNLAYLAAESGRRTLLWDLDAQGGASWYLRGESEPVKLKKLFSGGTPAQRLIRPTPYAHLAVIAPDHSYRYLDVILKKIEPPKAALKKLLALFARDFDLIVLDCPPSLSHLADNVFAAADLVLVPVVPTHLSLRALEQLRAHYAEAGLPQTGLKPFFSMVDRRRSLHAELIERPPKLLANRCRAYVPYSSMVERMGEHRAPVCAYAPDSHIASQAYRALGREVLRALERG